MMDAKTLGAYGESFAASNYRKKGFEIVCANFRTRQGEIDLIVKKKNLLVFVEVKTRKENSMLSGRLAVDYHKQQRIILAAKSFLAQNPKYDCKMRFDVYEVIYKNGQVSGTCIENAFTL